MKKIILLLAISSLAFTAQAKLWRINNGSGVNANFPSFAAAQSGASANDSLYFEGSPISYGNITVTKPLIMIGPGYFLEQNPQTQASFVTAKLGTIAYNTGSYGSIITGMEVQGTITISESNIRIIRCLTQDVKLNSSTSSIGNILLLGNYLLRGVDDNSESNTMYNLIFSNNFFDGSITLGTNASGKISNNIFNYDVKISNFTFTNNIQIYDYYPMAKNNNVFLNNIGNSTQFPIGNGNQQNISKTDIFIGSTGNSTDGQWKLKPYSVAIGAGNDGTDCGMFGGSSPYVLSGLPSIPAIYEITMPTTGDNINGINVTIKAKTH